ncbi:DUF523 domain-containing protein [Enterococcus sp. UD-01]|uniref:DUF523 domain-containing protein n=1 Tax=Enterococcus sp. UD-01 TaxID=3373911 RepID=UPI0038396A55
MIGISACLGGVCCRYDGKAKEIKALKELVAAKQAVVICPEVIGGLPTPREPAEIVNGDGFDVWQKQAQVLTVSGMDVTQQFRQGAIAAYEELKNQGITTIILKEGSPSCGSQRIYDGSFSGITKAGVGVAAAYFMKQGINVIPESDWQRAFDHSL